MRGATVRRGLLFFRGAALREISGADASAWGTELGTSTRSSTATKKPPVSVVSGEARRQCSAPGKLLRPRWGQEGRTGASLKVPGFCCRASCTTSSFSSWQREHVEYTRRCREGKVSAWRSARCWNPARACRRALLGVPVPGSSSCLVGIPKDKVCHL